MPTRESCGFGGVLLQNSKIAARLKLSPSFRVVMGFILSGVRQDSRLWDKAASVG